MSLVDISDGTHLGITDIQPFYGNCSEKETFSPRMFSPAIGTCCRLSPNGADKDPSENSKCVLAINEEKMTPSQRACPPTLIDAPE